MTWCPFPHTYSSWFPGSPSLGPPRQQKKVRTHTHTKKRKYTNPRSSLSLLHHVLCLAFFIQLGVLEIFPNQNIPLFVSSFPATYLLMDSRLSTCLSHHSVAVQSHIQGYYSLYHSVLCSLSSWEVLDSRVHTQQSGQGFPRRAEMITLPQQCSKVPSRTTKHMFNCADVIDEKNDIMRL